MLPKALKLSGLFSSTTGGVSNVDFIMASFSLLPLSSKADTRSPDWLAFSSVRKPLLSVLMVLMSKGGMLGSGSRECMTCCPLGVFGLDVPLATYFVNKYYFILLLFANHSWIFCKQLKAVIYVWLALVINWFRIKMHLIYFALLFLWLFSFL